MLLDVQIDGELCYIIPIEATEFHPLASMVIASDLYFWNFSVLPISELVNEVLLYSGLYINKLLPACFYYLRDFQNVLMDLGFTPSARLFFYFFSFMGGKGGYCQSIVSNFSTRKSKNRELLNMQFCGLLSFPPTKHDK